MSSCARASSGLPSHGFMTEEGEYLYTEGGDYIILEEAGSLDGYIATQDDLYITTQSGDSIVTECFTEEVEGGGVARAPAKRRPSRRPTQPTKVEKNESELWEIGASVNRINDNIYGEPITIKKYITEDNDIKVIIGENIYLKSPDIIMENVTAKLVSNRIRE